MVALKALSKRVDALDKQIESAASESVFWPVVQGLLALRGVSLLTATTIVAEIGDLRRFGSAPQLIAYLLLEKNLISQGASSSNFARMLGGAIWSACATSCSNGGWLRDWHPHIAMLSGSQ